jgi:hypothetical protein
MKDDIIQLSIFCSKVRYIETTDVDTGRVQKREKQMMTHANKTVLDSSS